MMLRRCWLLAAGVTLAALTVGAAVTRAAEYPFVFKDVGDEAGIFPHAAGIRGHGAAWGDANGDGYPELFIANFHNSGSKPGVFLRNNQGKFTLDPQEHLHTTGIGSGALFVDLTNSGRLDLYVSHCAYGKGDVGKLPSLLFRNDGDGKFTDVSKESGACPPNYAGRGLTALDFDGDGLLDLLTCEQYYSPEVKTGPALYRSKGGHRFENVSEAAGLPVGHGGLAVVAADVNGDGWPDIFLSHGGGDHRLLLNDGKGKFREAPGTREVFRWNLASSNDTPAGISIADINRDGLPDVVIGHHFKSPWTTPASIRLYLHRGIKDGVPKFEEITEAAGLKPLAMKAPHVEFQDFDNDGLPDIYLSIVKFKDGKPCPVIYKNLGARDGLPRFREDAWAVNDFPTAADLANRRSGPLFERIRKENKIIYMAAAPSADYDRDGRIDLFLANWWIDSRSLLLRNETPGGHWLDVRVEGKDGVNRMGVGSRVTVFPAGKLGDAKSMLGAREISIGNGYCSGQEAIAHFGLGEMQAVDVEVVLPHGKGRIVRKDVKADQRIVVKP
jgi:enediyne biosynthesis protein E4